MRSTVRKWIGLVGALAVPVVVVASLQATTVHAAAPTALILGPSVVAGTATDASGRSLEEEQAANDGFTVTVVTAAQWDAMTAAQFASYRVLIIGDPECQTSPSYYSAAATNQAVWEPVVMASGGNRIVIGTDPTLHSALSQPGAITLEANGIAYAGAASGATGAYIDLSCAYFNVAAGTALPILDGLSTHGANQFTVQGQGATTDAAKVVGSTPQTAGLTSASLSNWGSSGHDMFDTWPSDWTPLVIVTDPSAPKLCTRPLSRAPLPRSSASPTSWSVCRSA